MSDKILYHSFSFYTYILFLSFFFLLSGARNDTRRAIESAVCVPHDFHCVHLQMNKLRHKLSGSLHMASQIFYSPGVNYVSFSL